MTSNNATDDATRRHASPEVTRNLGSYYTPEKLALDLATPSAPLLEKPLRRYPGGKNGAGVFQRLINLIPPHDVYVEPFLGSGAVLARKLPALLNIGIDADERVIAAHQSRPRPGFEFIHADARNWLASRRWTGSEVVYCDPPYLGTARASARRVYRCELLEETEHAELLRVLRAIPARVILSGYASPLYDRELAGWNRVDFLAMTRGGLRPEVLWFNFPEPSELHDYRYIGDNYRERLRIARKVKRWTRNLAALPTLERAAILSALRSAATPPATLPTAAASVYEDVARSKRCHGQDSATNDDARG